MRESRNIQLNLRVTADRLNVHSGVCAACDIDDGQHRTLPDIRRERDDGPIGIPTSHHVHASTWFNDLLYSGRHTILHNDAQQ